MKPYTYLIKHIPTNTFYYGVRYSKDCDPKDFWVKYFTSSNKVKQLRKQYGDDSFIFEIRKEFDSVEKAIHWEERVLRRMKIPHRNDFLNHRYSYAIPSMSDSSHPLYNLGHTLISREKMSKSHVGKYISDVTRKKMSESRKGTGNPCYGKFGEDHPAFGTKRSQEFKNSLSNRLKQQNPMHNLETRAKMSATKKGKSWWNNGVISKQFHGNPGEEWVRGRLSYINTKINKEDIWQYDTLTVTLVEHMEK